MSVVQDRSHTSSLSAAALSLSAPAADDPVSRGLRDSRRRMAGIAVFSGVINLLMLSGSLYMLQVYDRVIPSRNLATLFGLSSMVLFAYLMQGYFEALRSRMLCRVATLFDVGLQEAIHTALATLPLRGAKPTVMQQPLRDLDQIRAFMSGMGPTAFLDMPWIPVFLLALFTFHPAIGLTALLGTASIIAMTLLTERLSRGAAKAAMESSAQRYVLQAGMLGIGAYLVVSDKASGGVMVASSIMMGRALAPVEVALGSWKQLVAARQGIARLREVCKATARPPLPAVALVRPSRELSVHELTVAAPGTDTPIVSNISFKLPAGTGLALLGA